jgi:hypothetical protein
MGTMQVSIPGFAIEDQIVPSIDSKAPQAPEPARFISHVLIILISLRFMEQIFHVVIFALDLTSLRSKGFSSFYFSFCDLAHLGHHLFQCVSVASFLYLSRDEYSMLLLSTAVSKQVPYGFSIHGHDYQQLTFLKVSHMLSFMIDLYLPTIL